MATAKGLFREWEKNILHKLDCLSISLNDIHRGDFDQIKIYIFSQCVKEEMHRLLSKGGFAL